MLRIQDEGIGKKWGVKSIKSKRDDGHGNIEILVEWDGNWADGNWEPPVNLKIAAELNTYDSKPRVWVGYAETHKKKGP